MTHRIPSPDHDPIDLLIKGIFWFFVPVGSVVVSLALLTFGIQAVLP